MIPMICEVQWCGAKVVAVLVHDDGSHVVICERCHEELQAMSRVMLA